MKTFTKGGLETSWKSKALHASHVEDNLALSWHYMNSGPVLLTCNSPREAWHSILGTILKVACHSFHSFSDQYTIDCIDRFHGFNRSKKCCRVKASCKGGQECRMGDICDRKEICSGLFVHVRDTRCKYDGEEGCEHFR